MRELEDGLRMRQSHLNMLIDQGHGTLSLSRRKLAERLGNDRGLSSRP